MPMREETPSELNTARVLLVVVGAHLRAEVADRPIAYRLLARIESWLKENGESGGLTPIVCTDLWHLNHAELRGRPTISIGGPAVNALTAYLADKLASVLAIEKRLIVQMDPELIDVVACCWGAEAGSTLAAVDAFADRYLDDFMKAAVRAVG